MLTFDDKGGWGGQKSPKTCLRNTWMFPTIKQQILNLQILIFFSLNSAQNEFYLRIKINKKNADITFYFFIEMALFQNNSGFKNSDLVVLSDERHSYERALKIRTERSIWLKFS